MIGLAASTSRYISPPQAHTASLEAGRGGEPHIAEQQAHHPAKLAANVRSRATIRFTTLDSAPVICRNDGYRVVGYASESGLMSNVGPRQFGPVNHSRTAFAV